VSGVAVQTTVNMGVIRDQLFEARHAERRVGQLLRGMTKHPPGPIDRSWATTDLPPKLSDLGITRDQSSKWQEWRKIMAEARKLEAEKTKTGDSVFANDEYVSREKFHSMKRALCGAMRNRPGK